jgi:two-component system, NarL family, response regulator EvgA
MAFAAIVDDHPAFAEITENALRVSLGLQAGVLIQTISDGLQLLPQLQPDIVILDNRLEDGCGTELLRVLQGKLPKTRWLLHSGYLSARILEEAIMAGATGAVAKQEPLTTVISGVRALLAGHGFFCEKSSALSRIRYDGERLTPTERLIAKEVAAGREPKEIASILGVAHKTVLNELVSIRRKTGTHSLVQLADYARKHGIAEPRWWEALR